MQAYAVREEAVVNFVSDIKPTITVEPAQIFDIYGPTITDPDLQCLVVSQETSGGGQAVNKERLNRVCFIASLVFVKHAWLEAEHEV